MTRLQKITKWLNANNTLITWWIIGWMSFATLDSLLRGNFGIAALDVALLYGNYYMWKIRDV